MNTVVKAFAFVFVAALFAACASPPKVRVDKDSTVNFANYKTFTWFAPQMEPAKETKPIAGQGTKHAATPEVNSLVENRVRAAVVAALQSKGFSQTDVNPDFRVSYRLSVYERPKDSSMRIGLGAGGGSGNVSGGVGVSIPIGKHTDVVGAMTIDMIDTVRNSQVWTGSYEDKVEAAGLSDANAQKLVTTILARFPPDKSTK
jgi:Domain of unknown function (DUF4136)